MTRTYTTKLEAVERVLLEHRSALFTKPSSDEQAVLLFSGGMDSVLSAYMLLEKTHYSLELLYVDRQARARESELQSAARFADMLQQKYGSRVSKLIVVNASYPPAELKPGLPQEHKRRNGHPGRNAHLVLVAAYALKTIQQDGRTARTIFMCNSPDDTFSHSQLFALRAVNSIVCADLDDWSIQVTSPLLEPGLFGRLSKSDMIRFARDQHIPYELTHTCTKSNMPCGNCDECTQRSVYLEEA